MLSQEAPGDRPPEIQALYHIFEAVKLWHGAGHRRIAQDFLLNAQLFASAYSEANGWVRETNAWSQSLDPLDPTGAEREPS